MQDVSASGGCITTVIEELCNFIWEVLAGKADIIDNIRATTCKVDLNMHANIIKTDIVTQNE
jgi:hypothetical protein